MGFIEKVKFWRGAGRVLNTGAGSAIAEATGGVINKLAAAARVPELDSQPIPWTPWSGLLSESTVALITTAGLYLEGDEPFNVDKAKGDPTNRVIPAEADLSQIKVAHTHYSHRYVDQDVNVLFPLDRLRELAKAGVLKLAPRMFSFGFGGRLTKAYIDPERGTAHAVANELASDEVDLVLLVPA